MVYGCDLISSKIGYKHRVLDSQSDKLQAFLGEMERKKKTISSVSVVAGGSTFKKSRYELVPSMPQDGFLLFASAANGMHTLDIFRKMQP
jgi:hypothetical protein